MSPNPRIRAPAMLARILFSLAIVFASLGGPATAGAPLARQMTALAGKGAQYPTQRAPTAKDDSVHGFAVGDEWVDRTTRRAYVATSVVPGAATWAKIAPTFTLPLDLKPVTTGGAAYGPVKLRAAYSGPAKQVVRASDSATYDVGWVSVSLTNGATIQVMDLAGEVAFRGASTTKDSIWYDQSGNGNDAVQSTSGNRPISVGNTVLGLPAFTLNGASTDLAVQGRQMVLPAGVTFNRNTWSVVSLIKPARSTSTNTLISVGDTTTKSAVWWALQWQGFDGSQRISALQAPSTSLFQATTFSSTQSVYWQNEKTSTVVASHAGSTITGGALGQLLGSVSQQGNFDALVLIIYPETLQASDVNALRRSLLTTTGLASQADYNVVIDGTSLEAGTGSTNNRNWPQQMRDLVTVPMLLVNRGQPSSTVAGNITSYPTRVAPVYFPYKKNLLILGGPANSINTNVTGADTWTQTQSYLALAKATGYSVVVSTCLPMATWNATQLGEMEAYNALVRANWASAGFVDIADIAADPVLSSQANMSNPAHSPDGIHRTTADYGLYARIYAPVVANLYRTLPVSR